MRLCGHWQIISKLKALQEKIIKVGDDIAAEAGKAIKAISDASKTTAHDANYFRYLGGVLPVPAGNDSRCVYFLKGGDS
jgi:hypothetical protein